MSTTNRSINRSVVYECMEKNVCKKYASNLSDSYIEKLSIQKAQGVHICFVLQIHVWFLNLKNQIGRVMAGHNMETMF